jgi:hypothetical protein
LDQIPAKDSSSDGCCQYRNFSSSLWTANLQQMRKGWETAIKATRDAEKIATCRAAGLTILETPTVEALHFVNIAGTTAQSVDIPDSLLGKIVAHEHGVNLTNSVLMILPSASSAVNRIAMRRNAAAYLLEAAMAKVQPSSVSVGCLDNSMLRSDEPIYDHLYPIGSINGYQATTNQDEVTCRLGVLALLFLTTNFMPWADQEFANTLRNQQDKRFGALICRNIGWTRHFTSPEIRRQVMKAAAINHLRQNI